MKKYRSRQVVEAEQWDGRDHPMVGYIAPFQEQSGSLVGGFHTVNGGASGSIRKGDWIVMGEMGVISVMRDKDFRAAFEEEGPQIVVAGTINTVNM